MLMEWIKNNLTLSNLVLIAVGLFGFGGYYKATEIRAESLTKELADAKEDIKELKAKLDSSESTQYELKWKVDRLTSDVAEIKLDVKATLKAVR
jgi:peptidoglycan hydrolase CwlO-like protein